MTPPISKVRPTSPREPRTNKANATSCFFCPPDRKRPAALTWEFQGAAPGSRASLSVFIPGPGGYGDYVVVFIPCAKPRDSQTWLSGRLGIGIEACRRTLVYGDTTTGAGMSLGNSSLPAWRGAVDGGGSRNLSNFAKARSDELSFLLKRPRRI